VSWHFLRGQVEASWEGSCSDGNVSALLKLIHTPAASCSPDKPTDALNRSPFGMTLRRSTGTRGAAGLTWYRGDSPVRTYRLQAKEQGSLVSGLDCGPSLPGSWAKYNPSSYSWKTAQCLLLGGLESFSETWPAWGMMHAGECFPLARSVQHTHENACSFWPTPCKFDSLMVWNPKRVAEIQSGLSPGHGGGCRNFRDYLAAREETPKRWPLPEFVERVMMWPESWTDLQPLGMAKFRLWFDSHGIR